MRKNEIKKATNNALIVDYVKTYSSLCLNINLGMGTKQFENHCNDLEKEMLNRGLLTEEDIKSLQA